MRRMTGQTRLLVAGAAVLTTAMLLLIILPLASLLLRAAPGLLTLSFSIGPVRDALLLTLATATLATVCAVVIGTPLAYGTAWNRSRAASMIDTVIDLPLVLPPAVAGLALLMAFGRRGVIGEYLHMAGVDIAFSTAAVVIAQIFVASPLYIRQARTSFASLDPAFEQAARTLGATPLYTFLHITVPMAGRGLLSGAVMTWARALGEFGATIMFAGNLPGTTQTMPLAIYSMMQADLDGALAMAVLLVILSGGVIMAVRTLTRGERA
ncbi:ABC transporter permease [Methanosphaerula subterraneus]|uniref:ABC transporter permease n=1 Tax=Methanosphaerula subterraneus TaxID=3350244 RepID=UPI003F84789C